MGSRGRPLAASSDSGAYPMTSGSNIMRNWLAMATRITVALMVVATLGCSQRSRANRPKTHAVKGTVTLAGAPVADATVTFLPDGGGRGAVGSTGADGRYLLTTFQRNDGAVAGTYKVTVVKMTPGGPEPGPNYRGPRPEEPKHLLPARYASAKSSGLTATVAEGAPAMCDFVLSP